jgi:hypothetical protein
MCEVEKNASNHIKNLEIIKDKFAIIVTLCVRFLTTLVSVIMDLHQHEISIRVNEKFHTLMTEGQLNISHFIYY